MELREIAVELRALATDTKTGYTLEVAGRLVSVAIEQGAFSEPNFFQLRLLFDPSCYDRGKVLFKDAFRSAVKWLASHGIGNFQADYPNSGCCCPPLEWMAENLESMASLIEPCSPATETKRSEEKARCSLGDVLSDLRSVEWCFGHANRLADESRAAGVPEAGSEAAHKFILSAQYDGEGGKLNADLLAKPGVDRLQTICIAQCGTFTAGAFQRLCASAALTKDRTLDEFLAIDVSTGLQLLQSALGLPGAPEPCNLAPPPTDPPKRSEGKGRAGSPKPTSKRKRGRPADTDAKEDKRIYEAWKTGQHKTQADCDHELGLPAGGTYAACERHRKRLDRRNKRRRTK